MPLGPPLHTDEDTVECLTPLDINDMNDRGYAGPFIAGSGDDGRVQIWDVPSGQVVRSIGISQEGIDAITTVTTSFGAVVITGGVDGELRTWDASDGALLAIQPMPSRIRALRSSDEKLVLTFGWEVAVLR